MGCAIKNAKVVAIPLSSLQHLISLKVIPQPAVPHIINIMSDAMSQGVDIQVHILQTLVSLVLNFLAIHGDLLGDVHVMDAFGGCHNNVSSRHSFYVSSCRNPKLPWFYLQ